jgi:hypothetical protein
MAQQTAVEWLKQQYIERGETLPSGVFQEAKAIEKEQIINAWMATDNELQRIVAEQYYNETYSAQQ